MSTFGDFLKGDAVIILTRTKSGKPIVVKSTPLSRFVAVTVLYPFLMLGLLFGKKTYYD